VFLLGANPNFPGLPSGFGVPGTHLFHLKPRHVGCEEYLLWAQQSRKACEQSPSGLRGGSLGRCFKEAKMEIHGNPMGNPEVSLIFSIMYSFNYIVRVAYFWCEGGSLNVTDADMRDDVLPALLSEAGSFGSRVHE